MNGMVHYRAEERQTVVHSWGTVSETFHGGDEERYLGFGELVRFSRMVFHTGSSASPMTLLRNIELIDIVVRGSAGYQDGNGANAIFPENTIQIVSAGTGVFRSDYNASRDTTLEKLQIGILPQALNSIPVQTKALFDLDLHRNSFVTLVSPHVDDSSLSVGQHAALLLGKFEAGRQIVYDVSGSRTGLFFFVVNGAVTVGGRVLMNNDALALTSPGRIAVTFAEESVLLLMELEMPILEE